MFQGVSVFALVIVAFIVVTVLMGDSPGAAGF